MKPRRVLLWSVYLAATALAFEAMARLALTNASFRERVFTNDDAAWRLQWVARHLREGSLNYVLDDWNASRGWTLKANLRDVPFRGKSVSSNSRGARGVQELSLVKPPGVTRIVVLGDSFTFGEEVGDDETYSHVLQQLIPHSEVVNLGVHGYGHDQMLHYLREEGVKYKPDIVILGFLPDDAERNVLSFRDYAKPHYALKGGRLSLTTRPIPRPEDMLASEKWRSKFGDLLTMLRSRYEWRSGKTQAITRDLTWALLDEIKATSEAAGARVAYAYLPVYGEISRTDEGMTGRERAFFAYCNERRIQSLYLQPFFRQQARKGVSFKTQGHWDALDHRIAAEGMRTILADKGWIAAQ